MLIAFLGTRGTVPDAEEGTASILVDNRMLFDVGSEIISNLEKLRRRWKKELLELIGPRVLSRYGHPTFSKLEHIFLTHLHYDHWVGLPHLLHRAQLLELEYRTQKPYQVYVPEQSVDRLTNLLELMLGPGIFQILHIHPVSSGQIISIADDYTVTARTAKHDVRLPLITKDDTNNFIELNWSNWSLGGALSYRIEQKKEKLDKQKASELGLKSGRLLGLLRKDGSVNVGETSVSRTEVFRTVTTSLVYTGDTSFDPDLLSFCASADIIIHETSYLDRDESYHLENHSALEEILTEMEKLYKSHKVIVPIHFSQRYSFEEIEKALMNFQKKSSHNLLLPRTGMIIIFENQQLQVL